VVDGIDVMDRIAKVPTGARAPFPKDVPKTDVVIEKVSVIKEATQSD
jgi:cyclophilin family peptidyl-prolyl cis-trans isomerase